MCLSCACVHACMRLYEACVCISKCTLYTYIQSLCMLYSILACRILKWCTVPCADDCFTHLVSTSLSFSNQLTFKVSENFQIFRTFSHWFLQVQTTQTDIDLLRVLNHTFVVIWVFSFLEKKILWLLVILIFHDISKCWLIWDYNCHAVDFIQPTNRFLFSYLYKKLTLYARYTMINCREKKTNKRRIEVFNQN